MGIYTRTCLVCGQTQTDCRCAMGPCFHSGAAEVIAALRAQVEELEADVDRLGTEKNAALREAIKLESQRDLALGRATRAEAELAEFRAEANRIFERIRRHAAYQHKRAVEKIDDLMEAEAERDEARGRVEKLRKYAAHQKCCGWGVNAYGSPVLTGQCTCGLDAALAECSGDHRPSCSTCANYVVNHHGKRDCTKYALTYGTEGCVYVPAQSGA